MAEFRIVGNFRVDGFPPPFDHDQELSVSGMRPPPFHPFIGLVALSPDEIWAKYAAQLCVRDPGKIDVLVELVGRAYIVQLLQDPILATLVAILFRLRQESPKVRIHTPAGRGIVVCLHASRLVHVWYGQ